MCLLPSARVARGSDSIMRVTQRSGLRVSLRSLATPSQAAADAAARWAKGCHPLARVQLGGWVDIALYSAGELLVGADEGVELVEHALLGGAAALAVSQELAA